MKLGILALAASLSLAGLSAHAGTITNHLSSGNAQVNFFEPIGQSFTAIDSQLQTIGFQLGPINSGFPNDPISVDLYAGTGTGGALLASRTLTLPNNPDANVFTNFDFSGTSLTIGAIYSAALTDVGSSPFMGIRYSSTDTYAGGQAFSPQVATLNCSGSCDLGFQVVGTTAGVPEPATWGLMISGFGLAGAALRRRRAVVAA